MNGEGRELRTLADVDDAIARYEKARDDHKHKLEDPEQRKARETLREQVVGRYVMDCLRRGDAPANSSANSWVSVVVRAVPDKAWLFRDEVMAADGYESKPGPEGRSVWSRR